MISLEFRILCIAVAFWAASSALAQDNSLYTEAASDDASFVRFVGFQGGTLASFAGKTFDLSLVDAGAYIPVSSSTLEDVPAGRFQTVLRKVDGSVVTVVEAARNRQTKIFLFLINTTQQPLELRLADNSATVIEAVPSGESGQRGVNPVSVSLGVFAQGADNPLGAFDVQLQRGQNLSFVATEQGIELIENSFGPVAK